MRHSSKKLLALLTVFLLVFSLSIAVSAASAWSYFETDLPGNQGDREVTTVARGTNDPNFEVEITFFGGTGNAVRAWAEYDNIFDTNLSNPYTVIEVSELTEIAYSTSPAIGENIILNLDNPIKESAEPIVVGRWTPN